MAVTKGDVFSRLLWSRSSGASKTLRKNFRGCFSLLRPKIPSLVLRGQLDAGKKSP